MVKIQSTYRKKCKGRRKIEFYKVQKYNPIVCAWQSTNRFFNSLEEAKAYKKDDNNFRVVMVNESSWNVIY